MAALFSLVLEYRGGTYVSQYRGRSAREALRRWAEKEEQILAGILPRGDAAKLFRQFSEETPVALTGVRNAAPSSRGAGDPAGDAALPNRGAWAGEQDAPEES